MAEVDPALPDDGLVAFVKRDCPTCELVEPVLAEIGERAGLTIYTQDDPDFPARGDVIDDRSLEHSYRSDIEAVPTVVRLRGGREVGRAIGWRREDWEKLCELEGLGGGLPEYRPGCGSLSVDPRYAPELSVRYGGVSFASRGVELGEDEDAIEAMFARGWSDGLPLVPPTRVRVARMLAGTTREPSEVVGIVAPDLVPCTVEKVAINAVMAGCLPEYLPVVLAAVEAACSDEFNMHGLLATTMPTSPVIIVNGPIRRRIGMNAGGNVFGQGNRANSTIGRALQLVVRNVGGGRPGEVDRATFGNPGKLSFCFAEDEEGSPWTPLACEQGFEAGVDTVTLFPGEGPRSIVDQLSRDPESLARSFAANLRTLHHPKLIMAFDCILAVAPDHSRIFRDASWSKDDLKKRLHELLQLPGSELVRGAGGIAEGAPETVKDLTLPKFRPEGLLIVHCGGGAGLFSAMIGGWVNGEIGSQPVTREIGS